MTIEVNILTFQKIEIVSLKNVIMMNITGDSMCDSEVCYE